jgi:putative FmdB family regulatory protein
MPIYEYECACGQSFADLLPSSDASEARNCPACGQVARRIVSAPFYANRSADPDDVIQERESLAAYNKKFAEKNADKFRSGAYEWTKVGG